jgi:hypothetical protein
MDTRVERIVLETAHYRIVGDVTMPREGYRSRLSDYLNHGELDFIPLANVVVSPIGGPDEGEAREFIAVGRTHVQLAYPASRNGPGLA